jgi:6-phospho-3-hexuloisomerase
MPDPEQPLKLILTEMASVLDQIQQAQVQALEEALLQARAIFITGEGRSGLVGRCFAMRLMHLGLTCHVVGEATTPALTSADLLIAISGSGETPVTCLLASSAARQGARVAAIVGTAGSTLAGAASFTLLVPAAADGMGVASRQFGGTLFEQCVLVVLDAVALNLQHRLGQTDGQMRARHTTLE